MILFTVLAFAAFLTIVFLTFMCLIFYFCEGNWPLLHFRIFASWWWPFRQTTAATMLADTMIGEVSKDWSKSGYKTYKNSKLRATVEEFCGDVKVHVNDIKVPLSVWDRHVICQAMGLFEKGKRRGAGRASTQAVAEAIVKAYGGKE